jgi:LCP family protein required for cell wall assembly
MKRKTRQAVKPRISRTTTAIRILSIAFGVGALLSLYLAFSVVRNLAAAWSGTGLPSFRINPAGGQPTVEGEPTATPVLLDQLPDPWNGTERVTILLMGLDYRDWSSEEGPPRTDSMMLVTLDPVSQTGGMLSIPRDLWVDIPAYGHGRINTAYFLAERDRLPGGGPALAVKTVEKFLGVPIQYYVQIDFGAFIRMVDEIGGIEVDLDNHIWVDPIGDVGRFNTVLLSPGKQVLNGELTLAYARARKTEGGDFDRSRRQQEVALAIRDRILSLGMVPTLITRAPNLYDELASGIHTNLSLDEMIGLALLAVRMPRENIKSGVIGPPDMVTLENVLYGGEQAEVLKPVPDQIRQLRDVIFASTSAIGPSIEADDSQSAAGQEGARIAVLNGAGQEGLASQTAELLQGFGFNIVEVGNADFMDYPQTRVVDYTGNPYTTQYLMELMNLTQGQILFQTDAGGDIDVAVVMGYDWFEVLSLLTQAASE